MISSVPAGSYVASTLNTLVSSLGKHIEPAILSPRTNQRVYKGMNECCSGVVKLSRLPDAYFANGFGLYSKALILNDKSTL